LEQHHSKPSVADDWNLALPLEALFRHHIEIFMRGFFILINAGEFSYFVFFAQV
jgi:hypothetical protein